MRPYFYYSKKAGKEIVAEADDKKSAVKKIFKKLDEIVSKPDKERIKEEIFK